MREMKKVLFVLFVLFLSNANAQQSNLSRDLLKFPVSPEAARLGTYGNVPVNLYTGRLNKSVELFSTKVRDFDLVLNLSYNYSGNRVEESPSIMGLGWQLNAGGVVSREVRGLPDCYSNNYYDFRTSLIGNKLFNLNLISIKNAEKLLEGRFDTEPDRYNVTVNGINFGFKIGLDGMPIFLSKHNNKIEIIRNEMNLNQIIKFVVTDSKSNKYYFEDIETSEQISGVAYHDPTSIYDLMHPVYESSWQLTKIITKDNATIYYNYQNDDFTNYQFYASGTGFSVNCYESEYPKIVYDKGCNKFLIKRKLLTSITNEVATINFNITTVNGNKIYDEIKILNPNEVIKYNFTYFGYRNYLTKINKNNQFYEGYKYNGFVNPFIDSEFSENRNQDWWGYNNGINNLFLVIVPFSNIQTNRKPNLSTTIIGSMSEIEYPTKGTTKITYELNKRKSPINKPNVSIDLKFKTDNDLTKPAYKEIIITKTFDTNVFASLSHYISDKNHIDLKIVKDGVNLPSANYYDAIPLLRTPWEQIPMYTPNYIFYATVDGCASMTGCPPPCNCVENLSSNGLFKLMPGTYTFKIDSNYNNQVDASGEIILNFYDSAVYPYTAIEDIGGIRVAKTIDFDGQNNKTTFYDYDISNEIQTGNILSTLNNVETYRQEICDKNETKSGCARQATVFNSSPSDLLINGSPKCYEKVNESIEQIDVVTSVAPPIVCNNCTGLPTGNVNYDGSSVYSYIPDVIPFTKRIFPKGYKTYNYYPSTGNGSGRVPIGHDLSFGRVKAEAVFSSNTTTSESKILYEKSNDYLTQLNTYNVVANPNYPKSIKLFRKRQSLGCDFNDQFIDRDILQTDFYEFQQYQDVDSEYLLQSTKTKEYYENQVAVENTTTIVYDNYDQPKTITTTDSKNSVITNELFYPYNTDTTNDGAYDDMLAKNNINTVVKVVNKKNSEITDSYKYDFKLIANSFYKPSAFWKSKGSGLLEKLTVFDYDTKGNIIMIKNVESETQTPAIINGTPTTIIWGYNQTQIIAKIENATNAEVQSQVASLQAASNLPNNEANLLIALTALRTSLPNAMVTTYTHKPLIGVSTITDPKGDKITYNYDSFNRLQNVIDKNGNILTENQYNYKQ